MTKYTIDSQVTYTTEVVTREEFLQFIKDNECWGLIRYLGRDNEWYWDKEGGLCFTDEDFDWKSFQHSDCIGPQCIQETLGDKPITEWNIIWSDDGYPVAQAVVGEWQ